MIILVVAIIVRFVPEVHIPVGIQKHTHVLVVRVIPVLRQEIVALALIQGAVAVRQLEIQV